MNAKIQISEVIHTYLACITPPFRQALEYALRDLDTKVPYEPSESQIKRLPLLCCLAAGGERDRGVIVSAAFHIASIAANVLDDVQDADNDKGLWRQVGPAQAINSGMALSYVAQAILGQLEATGVPRLTVAELQTSYMETVLEMCAGQHQDLSAEGDSEVSLDDCWQMIEKKTAVFFSWACRAGALLGHGANVTAYATFGHHLGLLHQLCNDLMGLHHRQGKLDLVRRKKSLPVAYAFTMATARVKQQLETAWRAAPYQTAAQDEVRQLLQQLGVSPYLLLMSEVHYQAALTALHQTGAQPEQRKPLIALLEQFRLVKTRNLS